MIGLVVLVVLAIGLYTVRNFGRRLIVRLPLPASRASSSTTASRKASSRSMPRRVPLIAFVTALIWATEALRLYLVVAGARLRRPPRHQRRVLRGPDRLAADGHPVHAGRPGHRRAGRGRHPDAYLRRRPRRRPPRSPSSTAPSACSRSSSSAASSTSLSDKTKADRQPVDAAAERPSGRRRGHQPPENEDAGLSDRHRRGRGDCACAARQLISCGSASVPRARCATLGPVGASHGAVLSRRREAAHAQREVVLHDLANLRLAQQIVGAQRVLDARRWVAGRRARRARSSAGVSVSSRSSRRPRASLVAVPSEGVRSPRTRREIVE